MSIVKHKTVHAAAGELRITQTGVTQRVRSLERWLGATLFTRSRRGMLLTSDGEALLRNCQAARDLEGEALAKIRGAGKRSAVRVCVTGPTSIMRSRLIPQCFGVAQKYPELLLSFEISDLGNGAESLKAGTAQLAVLPREQVGRELDSKLLKPEKYVLVACREWKRRSLGEIVSQERIIDFDPADSTTFAYLKKFKLLERARAERHFLNNTESLAEMIQSGLGYGVLTLEFASRYLERERLVVLNGGRAYENELALAWYPRPEPPEYWKALVSALK